MKPVAVEINVWLKGILNLFKSREKLAKKLLASLLAVERAQIVALHMERLLERQVAKRLESSKSSVHRAIAKFKHEIYEDMKKLVDPVKLHEEMIMPSDELSCNSH